MKTCPKCNQSYDDPNLNFCLSDGEVLLETETQDAPPTIVMDAPRVTNDGNWGGGFNPEGATQNMPYAGGQPNQEVYRPPTASPQSAMQIGGKDQTLPTVSIITGGLSVVLSLCCYLGALLGPIALITGFIGMKNVNNNPDAYDGKNLAVIGMIAGGVGLAVSLLLLVLGIIAQLF